MRCPNCGEPVHGPPEHATLRQGLDPATYEDWVMCTPCDWSGPESEAVAEVTVS